MSCRRRLRARRVVLPVLGATLLTAGCAGFNAGELGELLKRAPLDNETIVSGLREALSVGTQRAVDATSQVGGFSNNPRIRIPLPEELENVASTLRRVGLGERVDEFELAMNRGAEEASGEAVEVFWSAIRSLTWTDARAILDGDDTAATMFFRNRTEAELERRFFPIVDRKMSELGYMKIYDQLLDAYDALPLTTKPDLDPSAYVTRRALSGLFTILGDEEKRIREDPAARTTALLRRVFARSGE